MVGVVVFVIPRVVGGRRRRRKCRWHGRAEGMTYMLRQHNAFRFSLSSHL